MGQTGWIQRSFEAEHIPDASSRKAALGTSTNCGEDYALIFVGRVVGEQGLLSGGSGDTE